MCQVERQRAGVLNKIKDMSNSIIDKIIAVSTGSLLTMVSFWSTLLEMGFISLKSLLIGLFGGIGGLGAKWIINKVKKGFDL